MKNTSIRGAMLAPVAGAAVALGLAATPAAATNGYFANGYGGGSKSMAGAGVAVPTGVLGLAQNPAMGLKVGNQAGFCLTLFSPRRSFDVDPGGILNTGHYDSKNEFFPIPCGGVNFKLSDRTTLGFFMFGNGGMNSEYDSNVFPIGTTPLGVNLEQLFITANISHQVNEHLTLGFGPVFALQRFSATGLELFDNAAFSASPGNVTGNGDAWSNGGGVNLGLLWEPNAQWDIGLSYRSRMFMTPFGKYEGLFAEQGDFDIPPVATIGAAYTPASHPKMTLTAEYQRIFYGDINALSNSHASTTALRSGLGNDNGPGFGWKDMDVVRVAGIYRYSPKLTLRGGVSYATQFIENDEVLFNVLAPATPQWHASIGASYQVNEKWGITTSYTHSFDNTVSGANPVPGLNQPVSLQMVQDEIAIGMTYKW